jgi:hypothetical protein
MYISFAKLKNRGLIMFRIFIIVTLAFCFSFSSALSFSGNGSGTEEDPYQITNVHQLQEMNDDLDAHYILMNDIDASETRTWNVGDHDGDSRTTDSAMGFVPIGDFIEENPTAGFTGTLDGQDYMISSLYINRPLERNVGMFGCIADDAYVHDVNIGVSYVRAYIGVGGFVGRIYAFNLNSEVYIDRCSSQSNAFGKLIIGGFSGENYTKDGSILIKSSHSSGTVGNSLAYLDAGGFCGLNFSGISGKGSIRLIDCSSSSNITAMSSLGKYTGGFCGENYALIGDIFIADCYATGSVSGFEYIGGFCGNNYGIEGTALINSCYSSGDVFGNNDRVGGFCGANEGRNNKAIIKDSYSTGSVSGGRYVGGFCGSNSSDNNSSVIIENCYCLGKISGNKNYSGFCGIQSGKGEQFVINSYWDTQTSGITESDGGEGKATPEMMMQSTFENWDFDNVWCIVEGKTYPHLQHFVDCDTLVSVPDIESSESIGIYPNPTTSQITLTLGNEFISYPEIDIIDYLGNVKRYTPSGRWSPSDKSININTSFLSPGVYFLRIRSGEKVEVIKFVVI